MVPTRDHDVIQAWAVSHNATPAQIKPLVFDGQPAVLTFLVGNATGTPEIHPISWEMFFATFDLLGLSFAFADDRSARFDIVRVEKRSPPAVKH